MSSVLFFSVGRKRKNPRREGEEVPWTKSTRTTFLYFLKRKNVFRATPSIASIASDKKREEKHPRKIPSSFLRLETCVVGRGVDVASIEKSLTQRSRMGKQRDKEQPIAVWICSTRIWGNLPSWELRAIFEYLHTVLFGTAFFGTPPFLYFTTEGIRLFVIVYTQFSGAAWWWWWQLSEAESDQYVRPSTTSS